MVEASIGAPVERPSLAAVAGYGISAWALLFALPHVYWGLGGRAGLSGTVGAANLHLFDDPWVQAIGLWGVALLCAIAALYGLAVARPCGRVVPRWLLLGDALAACALLGLRGASGVLVAGLAQLGLVAVPDDPDIWQVVHSSLLLWSPGFLAGAALFAAAAWGLRRQKAGR